MNKYIVAYINCFDNNLKQTMVEAESEISAAYKYLAEQEDSVFELSEQHNNLEKLVESVFDMDANISVYKIE